MDVWLSVKKACLGEAETPWPVGCHGGTTDNLEETSWDARASLDGATWTQQWFLSAVPLLGSYPYPDWRIPQRAPRPWIKQRLSWLMA